METMYAGMMMAVKQLVVMPSMMYVMVRARHVPLAGIAAACSAADTTVVVVMMWPLCRQL